MIFLFSNLMNRQLRDVDGVSYKVIDATINTVKWTIKLLEINVSTDKLNQWISPHFIRLDSRNSKHFRIEFNATSCFSPSQNDSPKLTAEISGKDLCDSKYRIDIDGSTTSLDFLVDSHNWELLYMVSHPILKKTSPLIIPFSSINIDDVDKKILSSSLSDDVLLRSPCFIPKTFGEWEHQVLAQFYAKSLKA